MSSPASPISSSRPPPRQPDAAAVPPPTLPAAAALINAAAVDAHAAASVRRDIKSPLPPAAEPDSPPPPSPPDDTVIDMDVFTQILDLDDDGQHDFSAGMVSAFFSQAQTAFEDMDKAHSARDLTQLKDLGHFLKGSAAALGIHRVRDSCETIQHLGALRVDESAIAPDDALRRIRVTLDAVKGEYAAARKWLVEWYADKGGIPDAGEGDGED